MAYREKDTKKWTAQWFESTATGEKKKRRKRGFETKKQALEYERQKKLNSIRSMDMKLSEFIDVYFEDKQNELKDRTIKNKRYMMEQHIIPYFGDSMMSEITASHIIQWQNEMQKKGFSESYLRMIQNQLTCLFTHASKIYDLNTNPCKKVRRMGSSDSRSLNFWTTEEYQKFINTMEPGTRYYLIFEILFWTGCRIGELLALQVKDIDFEKNQISITKTYYRTGRKDVVTEPKTKQSVRRIEIPEFLMWEIKDFVAGHYGMPDNERLFPIVQEAVQHKMKNQIKKAGVKDIRVHDLRHSHVAYLINKGVEPILIKERLGHKDIRITLNTYGHLYPNQQRRVADLLDDEKNKNVPTDGKDISE
jgi:integrase